MSESNGRLHGMVAWFSNTKGYGFIKRSDGEKDIFVHYSEIDMDGYKSLSEGQRVSFYVREGGRGPQAEEVRAEP